MTAPSRWEREAAEAGREATRRAIRRLDVLEWVILAAAAGVAVIGGLLVALLWVGGTGAGFRGTWIATSLVVLIVPGVIVLARRRIDERKERASVPETRADDDG